MCAARRHVSPGVLDDPDVSYPALKHRTRFEDIFGVDGTNIMEKPKEPSIEMTINLLVASTGLDSNESILKNVYPSDTVPLCNGVRLQE